MRPYSDRRRRRDRHYQKARQAALRLADGRCEAMTVGCTWDAEQIHHKAGRGGPDPHRLDNLLAVCAHCHGWIHANPVGAREMGWSVSRMSEVRPSRWTTGDTQ